MLQIFQRPGKFRESNLNLLRFLTQEMTFSNNSQENSNHAIVALSVFSGQNGPKCYWAYKKTIYDLPIVLLKKTNQLLARISRFYSRQKTRRDFVASVNLSEYSREVTFCFCTQTAQREHPPPAVDKATRFDQIKSAVCNMFY